MPEHPLRETVAAESASNVVGEIGEAFAMPSDADSESHLLRGLTALADRDVQRAHIARICELAGVDLSPAAAWLLIRLEREPQLDPISIGRAYTVEPERIRAVLVELRTRGYIAEHSNDGAAAWRELTTAGCEVLARLVSARRARLAELFSEWPPEKREELARVLRGLARELVPDVSAARST